MAIIVQKRVRFTKKEKGKKKKQDYVIVRGRKGKSIAVTSEKWPEMVKTVTL